MKSVILIRHAKSSWDFDVKDVDRPLNHRGKKDAPQMAQRLLERKIEVDAFISSPATRAFTTATFFAEAYKKKQKSVLTIPALYEAGVNNFFDTIAQLDNDFKTVAIFSHNPGITAFANSLCSVSIDDMPTCAMFAIKTDIKKWSDFFEAKKEFWFFDYPKAL